jgi:hypothetical protein
MPGKKWKSIKNPRVYEALKRKGYSKSKAAAISNGLVKRGRKGKRKKR